MIKNGILVGRLHSRETAAKLGEEPTGNARATGYRYAPIVRMTNTAIEGGDTSDRNFMVVVDMGTTTIVAHLVDARSMRTLDARACFNSQGVYGREVTRRMITAEQKGVEELQRLLVETAAQPDIAYLMVADIDGRVQ